jgi:hypothetical protein
MKAPRNTCPKLYALLGLALFQAGCADTINNHYYVEESAGQGGSGGDGGIPPLETGYPDAPKPDVEASAHELAPFEKPGTRFWLAVSEEQLSLMNEGSSGGGVVIDGPLDGDLYSPGGGSATFVDHLVITAPGENGQTADYGQVQAKIVGQSTRRPWNERSIPNLNLDADQFVDQQRIGGFEHLRLNNAQVGSIFREHVTLELFRRLGYPAPLSTYAWVQSNVWGKDAAIPYVLVERYKSSFCEREQEGLGGGCVNMWEFVGDFAQDGGAGPIPLDVPPPGPVAPPGLPVASVFDDPNSCQLERCDNTRVKELEALLRATPAGDGFESATEEFVDWPAFHRFQCLSWMFATGDDAIHGLNNVVLVERADGKFQYLPYSVDLSLGQTWVVDVPLAGQNALASRCQTDASCWANTISACEDLIQGLVELDPVSVLDEAHAELEAEGMLRDGDEPRYEFLRAWLEARVQSLPVELENNREAPQGCSGGMVDCGGYCDFPENCGNQVPVDLYPQR